MAKKHSKASYAKGIETKRARGELKSEAEKGVKTKRARGELKSEAEKGWETRRAEGKGGGRGGGKAPHAKERAPAVSAKFSYKGKDLLCYGKVVGVRGGGTTPRGFCSSAENFERRFA